MVRVRGGMRGRVGGARGVRRGDGRAGDREEQTGRYRSQRTPHVTVRERKAKTKAVVPEARKYP